MAATMEPQPPTTLIHPTPTRGMKSAMISRHPTNHGNMDSRNNASLHVGVSLVTVPSSGGWCFVVLPLALSLLLHTLSVCAMLGVPKWNERDYIKSPPQVHRGPLVLPDGPPWPELAATPMMAYNGWLASTEFMVRTYPLP